MPRLLMPAWLATLLALALPLAACTYRAKAPPSAKVRCTSSADCPSGYSCVPTAQGQVCCRGGDCGTDVGRPDGAMTALDAPAAEMRAGPTDGAAVDGPAGHLPPPGAVGLGSGGRDDGFVTGFSNHDVTCAGSVCVAGGLRP